MDYYCMIDKPKLGSLNTFRKAMNFHTQWWSVPVFPYLCSFAVCLYGFNVGIFALFYLLGYALSFVPMAAFIRYERKHAIYKRRWYAVLICCLFFLASVIGSAFVFLTEGIFINHTGREGYWVPVVYLIGFSAVYIAFAIFMHRISAHAVWGKVLSRHFPRMFSYKDDPWDFEEDYLDSQSVPSIEPLG